MMKKKHCFFSLYPHVLIKLSVHSFLQCDEYLLRNFTESSKHPNPKCSPFIGRHINRHRGVSRCISLPSPFIFLTNTQLSRCRSATRCSKTLLCMIDSCLCLLSHPSPPLQKSSACYKVSHSPMCMWWWWWWWCPDSFCYIWVSQLKRVQ